jgi:hypothetical protein
MLQRSLAYAELFLIYLLFRCLVLVGVSSEVIVRVVASNRMMITMSVWAALLKKDLDRDYFSLKYYLKYCEVSLILASLMEYLTPRSFKIRSLIIFFVSLVIHTSLSSFLGTMLMN